MVYISKDRGYKAKVGSVFLTLFVLTTLILAGPASAISVNLSEESKIDDVYKYKAIVDIHTDDHIPLDLIAVKVGDVNCYYNFQDHSVSDLSDDNGICNLITIDNVINKAVYSQTYGYGYGYGYGYAGNGVANTYWNTYGYGYNHGYGYNQYTENFKTDGEVVIEFSLDTSSLSVGTHTIKAGVSGIENSAIKFTYYNKNTISVTINEETEDGDNDGTGGSGGSVYDPTHSIYKPTIVQFERGYSVTLSEGDKIKFKIEGESHTLKVLDISQDTATVEIASTPQQVTFNVRDEKKFELNGDNYYDLSVKLRSIIGGYAEIRIQKINEFIKNTEVQIPDYLHNNDNIENNQNSLGNRLTGMVTGFFGESSPLKIGLVLGVLVFLVGFTFYKGRKFYR